MRTENEEDEDSTDKSSMKRTNRHVRIVFQKSAKKFKCEECHFSCAHRSSLSRHVRFTHRDMDYSQKPGDKLIKCDKCAYLCKRKDNLIAHMRVHEKIPL